PPAPKSTPPWTTATWITGPWTTAAPTGLSGKTTWWRSTGSPPRPPCTGSSSTGPAGPTARPSTGTSPWAIGSSSGWSTRWTRATHAPPLPPARGPAVPGTGSRRGARAEPGLEGHGPGPHRPGRGHLVRRVQPGVVDGALPHRRAHAERHGVQLQRHPRRGGDPMTAPQDEVTRDPADDRLVDVVVVGGSQAGLAMAWHLAQQGLRFVVLEAGPEVGHVWRSRWDSLKLFTPAQYDALPGMAFPAPADTYPTKDPVADYLLQAYVAA